MSDAFLPGSHPETLTSKTTQQSNDSPLSKSGISPQDSEAIQQFTQALEKSALPQGKKDLIKGQLNTLTQLLTSGSTESQQVMQSLKKTLSPLVKMLKKPSTQSSGNLQNLLEQSIQKLTESLQKSPHGMKVLKNMEAAQKKVSLTPDVKGDNSPKAPDLPSEPKAPTSELPKSPETPHTKAQLPTTLPKQGKEGKTPQSEAPKNPQDPQIPREKPLQVALPKEGKEAKTPISELPKSPETPHTEAQLPTTLPKQGKEGKTPQSEAPKNPQDPQTQREKPLQVALPKQGKAGKIPQSEANSQAKPQVFDGKTPSYEGSKRPQQDPIAPVKGEGEAKMHTPQTAPSPEGMQTTSTESVGKVNTTSGVDQAQNVSKVQQVFKQMVSHVQVMASKDMSQVSLSLTAPPELQGVEIKISTPSTAQNQLDIQFNQLSPDQQKFLEEHIQKNPNSQKQLSEALQPHGFTVNKMEVSQPTVANAEQGQGEQDQENQKDSSKQQQQEEEEEEENES